MGGSGAPASGGRLLRTQECCEPSGAEICCGVCLKGLEKGRGCNTRSPGDPLSGLWCVGFGTDPGCHDENGNYCRDGDYSCYSVGDKCNGPLPGWMAGCADTPLVLPSIHS